MREKTQQRLQKIFPEYFELYGVPPKEAHEECIHVYRACKTGKCDKDSFMPTFEEKGRKYDAADSFFDVGLYSLSTFEKARDIKRFASMNSDCGIPYAIAEGVTDPKYGLVQRTKERIGRKTSHVDWWLYCGATPWKCFRIIPDFNAQINSAKEGNQHA